MVGGTAGNMQAQPDIWWGGMFDYSVKPGPEFVKVKTRFGQVVGWAGLGLVWPFGDQVGQVQDQVGQGQVQELDNYSYKLQVQVS